jgi:MFS family permease
LTAAFAIPYILLQIPYGTLSDKWGYKYFLLWGYLLCSLTGMLYYYAHNTNLVFLGRFFQGMGESPVWALAPALLSIHYPTAKGKMIGMYNASIHLGLTLGPMLGILFFRIWQDNESFLFYAVVCLLGGIIVYFTVEDPHADMTTSIQRVSYTNVGALITHRERLVVLNGIMLYGAGYAMFLTVIPAFLIRVKGFGQTFIGIVFMLFYVAISISQVCTGPLSDKMGRKVFMIYGLSITAISLALFSGCSQPWISLLLFLASLGLGGFSLSSMALLNESVSDSLKGTISGAYYLFWGFGFFSGPLIISKIRELIGFQVSFSLFSGLLIVETILLMVTVKSPTKMTM